MKKRVLALLLVVAMIAGFAAGIGSASAAANEALKGTLDIFQFKVEINDAPTGGPGIHNRSVPVADNVL